MKKLLYILLGIAITLAVCRIVISLPIVAGESIRWYKGWIQSEKYLLIENGVVLTQKIFPRLGIFQIVILAVFALTGFFLASLYGMRLVKKILASLPKYKDHKEFILQLSAVVFVSLVLGITIGYGELCMRVNDAHAPISLLGYKLTNPAADSLHWKQQHAADERGMEFLLSEGVSGGDTFQHLNKQGFLSLYNYSVECVDSLRKARKIIVFVFGDSFVQGVQSTTWDKSFCELTRMELSDKYAIFNFGIAGTDPLDYKLRAEKFIPVLKPDMTVFCFCGNNDIMHDDRTPTPYTPLWINTPVGPICSNLHNKIILPTPDSLYRYFHSNVAANRAQNMVVKWACKKSYLVSLVYSIFNLRMPMGSLSSDTCEATYRNLKVIKEMCTKDSIPFQIAFIPEPQELKATEEEYQTAYNYVFKDLLSTVKFPLAISEEDFKKNDIHFNDKGNRKFANFVEQLILKTRAQ